MPRQDDILSGIDANEIIETVILKTEFYEKGKLIRTEENKTS